jgi:RecB family endonuclease NucS
MALRRRIEQLEPGLTIIDGDSEQTVAAGRIDITARNKDGSIVAIELKAGPADRNAIGQILYYIGDLTERSPRVCGIVVAREHDQKEIARGVALTGQDALDIAKAAAADPKLNAKPENRETLQKLRDAIARVPLKNAGDLP